MDIERLYELSEEADKYLQNKNTDIDINSLISEIKEIITPAERGFIGLAQLNPVVGDIEYNSKKIMKYISYATAIGLDMIVFPELSIMGYPIDDTPDRHSVIVEENVKWLNEIAKFTKKTTAVVGFIEPDGGKNYNSLAILSEGEIKKIIRKSDISEYSECYTINGIKYNISVSDDCFDTNNDVYDNSQVIIKCTASTSRNGKEQKRNNYLSLLAEKYNTPVIYINQVGGIDNLSFDGGSRVYNSDGTILARGNFFEEQLLLVNPVQKTGKIYTSPVNTEITESKTFSLDYEDDLERTYKTILQGIKDYFKKNGIKHACLGLSGGLDSTVCAVLLADAIGKENVFGISMPSKITSKESKSDAEQLAKNLGINFTEVPIKDITDTTTKVFDNLFSNVEKNWKFRYKKSYTQDNIQARTRAMYLWGVSNEFESCIPIATSDKSEAYMGYATINGDMSGGFAPIADVTKTKLFALARWLNKNRGVNRGVNKGVNRGVNVIPESVILKRPGAELAIDEKTGKPLKAEDALMPYEFLDEVIWRIENRHESYSDMTDSEFLYEKKHNVSKEQKIQWLDKFFKRMSTALYKGSIMPPAVIVEAHSINKYEYSQPITSSHINYKRVSAEDIKDKLKEVLLV